MDSLLSMPLYFSGLFRTSSLVPILLCYEQIQNEYNIYFHTHSRNYQNTDIFPFAHPHRLHSWDSQTKPLFLSSLTPTKTNSIDFNFSFLIYFNHHKFPFYDIIYINIESLFSLIYFIGDIKTIKQLFLD